MPLLASHCTYYHCFSLDVMCHLMIHRQLQPAPSQVLLVSVKIPFLVFSTLLTLTVDTFCWLKLNTLQRAGKFTGAAQSYRNSGDCSQQWNFQFWVWWLWLAGGGERGDQARAVMCENYPWSGWDNDDTTHHPPPSEHSTLHLNYQFLGGTPLSGFQK